MNVHSIYGYHLGQGTQCASGEGMSYAYLNVDDILSKEICDAQACENDQHLQ